MPSFSVSTGNYFNYYTNQATKSRCGGQLSLFKLRTFLMITVIIIVFSILFGMSWFLTQTYLTNYHHNINQHRIFHVISIVYSTVSSLIISLSVLSIHIPHINIFDQIIHKNKVFFISFISIILIIITICSMPIYYAPKWRTKIIFDQNSPFCQKWIDCNYFTCYNLYIELFLTTYLPFILYLISYSILKCVQLQQPNTIDVSLQLQLIEDNNDTITIEILVINSSG
eukprot:509756_1